MNPSIFICSDDPGLVLKLMDTGIHTRVCAQMKNPPKTHGYTPTCAIHYLSW